MGLKVMHSSEGKKVTGPAAWVCFGLNEGSAKTGSDGWLWPTNDPPVDGSFVLKIGLAELLCESRFFIEHNDQMGEDKEAKRKQKD